MNEKNSSRTISLSPETSLFFFYDRIRIYDFKVLGRNVFVENEVGGLELVVKEEEAEEMNVEHQKRVGKKREY